MSYVWASVHTNAGSLKDERTGQCATADNDLLAGLVDLWLVLEVGQWLRWYGLYSHGAVSLKDYLVNLGVDDQVQVLVHSTSAVDVRMSRV